jgi:RHS repeat-associated protein
MRLLGLLLVPVIFVSTLTAQPALAEEPKTTPTDIPDTSLAEAPLVQNISINTDQGETKKSDIVKITAKTDNDVEVTDDHISIIDLDGKKTVKTCDTGNSCTYDYTKTSYAPNKRFMAQTTKLSSPTTEVLNSVTNLYIEANADEISSLEDFQIFAGTDGPLPENKNIYFVRVSDGSIVGECFAYQAECSSEYLKFNETDGEQFKAVIADPSGETNISEFQGIVAESNIVTVSRTPWVLKLQTDTPEITEGIKFDLYAQTNQVVPDNLQVYMFNKSAGNFVSIGDGSACSNDGSTFRCTTDFAWDQSQEYIAYLAEKDDSITPTSTPNSLTGVRAVSNPTTIRQKPFAVESFVTSYYGTNIFGNQTFGFNGKINQPTTHYVSAIVGEGQNLMLCQKTDGCSIDPYPDSPDYMIFTDTSSKLLYPPVASAAIVVGRWTDNLDKMAQIQRHPEGHFVNVIAMNDESNTYEKQGNLQDLTGLTGGSNPSQACARTCVADPVNALTGEFWLQEQDAAVSSVNPMMFARYYAISKQKIKGSMGYGWNNNYDMKLYSADSSQTVADAKTLNVFQENGSLITFTKNDAGNYTTDLLTRATLTKTSNSFVLTRDKINTFTFDLNGRLQSIKTLNENTSTLNYTDNKLTSVTNGKGQTLTITWNTAGLIALVTTPEGRKTQYTYNSKSELTKITFANSSTFKYFYNANHSITSFTDERNNTTTNEYDDKNRLVTQTDANNQTTSLDYEKFATTVTNPNNSSDKYYFNEKYQVNHITKAAGSDSEYNEYYTFDAANNLTSISYPDGGTQEYNYDVAGNVTKSKDRAGNISVLKYNDLNEVAEVKNPAGNTSTITYDTKGNLATATDYNGNTTQYTVNPDGTLNQITAVDNSTNLFAYDSKGLLSKVTDALGDYSTFTYNKDGQLLTSTDANGRVTTLQYNNMGWLTKVIYPNNSAESYAYDVAGNVTTLTDRTGAVTTVEYDVLNRPIKQTDAAGQTIEQTYDSMGNVATVTDALGNQTSASYNQLNQTTAVTDAKNRETSYRYDNLGNLIEAIDPSYNSVHYSYNANGQITKAVNDANQSSSVSYNNLGQVVKTVDTARRATTYTYDKNGNPLTTKLPDSTVSTSQYDALNQLISYTDRAGKKQQWTYDAAGQTASFINTDNTTTRYKYDKVGNLSEETRPDNSLVSYQYSSTDQITKAIYADATITYNYNTAGQLTSEVAGGTTTSYGYDVIGNLTQRGPPTGAGTSYTYTPRNEVASITYPSGTSVSYEYDATGNLTQAYNADTGSFTYEYNDVDNLVKAADPNQVETNYQYTATNQLQSIETKNPNETIFNKEFGYNSTSGYLTSSTTKFAGQDDSHTENYSYNSLSQLSGITSDTLASGSYKYDGSGNLTTNLSQTQAYDVANKLSQTTRNGNTDYAFDGRGNRTAATSSAGTKTYEYNQQDQLTKTVQNGKTVSYTYDANGLLKNRKQGTSSANFVWDYNSAVPLLLDDGKYEYVYTVSNAPAAQINKSTKEVTYLHQDELGSVSGTTNANGDLTGSYLYTAFGEQQTVAGLKDTTHQKTRFGYAGEWQDPDTGLYNLRARWYDPTDANFINRDPLEQSTGEAYSYGSGNPKVYTDPLGLSSVGETIGQSIIGGLDGLSGGGTSFLAESLSPGIVDRCSPAFKNGQIVGTVASVAIPGIGLGFTAFKVLGLTTKLATYTKKWSQAFKLSAPTLRSTYFTERAAISFPAANVHPTTINKIIGDAASDRLAKSLKLSTARWTPGGTGARERPFYNVKGTGQTRIHDVWDETNLHAYESKIGRTAYTKRVKQELNNDEALLASGEVYSLDWRFVRSPITGKIGASKRVVARLEDLKQKYPFRVNYVLDDTY